MTGAADSFIQSLVNLPATTDFQRALKTEIVNIANEIAKGRLSLFVQGRDTISMPFLTILVFWLTVIYGIFGLLTRLDILVAVIVLLCAVSVSGSIFLILDMNRPFDGMMRIPSAQMRDASPARIPDRDPSRAFVDVLKWRHRALLCAHVVVDSVAATFNEPLICLWPPTQQSCRP